MDKFDEKLLAKAQELIRAFPVRSDELNEIKIFQVLRDVAREVQEEDARIVEGFHHQSRQHPSVIAAKIRAAKEVMAPETQPDSTTLESIETATSVPPVTPPGVEQEGSGQSCPKCGHPDHRSKVHQNVCTFYVDQLKAECGCDYYNQQLARFHQQ